MTDEHAHLVFAALADPTRRLLFQRLCEEGSGTATSLASQSFTDNTPSGHQAPCDVS